MRRSLTIPLRFREAYKSIQSLEKYPRYSGAFIFGSVARGKTHKGSDMDIVIVVDEDNFCEKVNLPSINGVTLNLSFRSFDQIKKMTDKQLTKGIRPPWIYEAHIVFDKIGKLTKLRDSIATIKPTPYEDKDYYMIRFNLYFTYSKVKKHVVSNPSTALLVLHQGIKDVLQIHYRLHNKWHLSDKKLLKDLKTWDHQLADLLEKFLTATNANDKFKLFAHMIDYILRPIGHENIETICSCSTCEKDINLFLKSNDSST